MEQEIIKMKNIVKNELTVLQDTCSTWYYMSSCVYLYFWIDFNPTGHVRLEYSCPDAVN